MGDNNTQMITVDVGSCCFSNFATSLLEIGFISEDTYKQLVDKGSIFTNVGGGGGYDDDDSCCWIVG